MASLALSPCVFGLGIYSMTDRQLPPPVSSRPFKYMAIVWALLLGYIFWGESPTPVIWLGTALILASGIAVLYGQRNSAR